MGNQRAVDRLYGLPLGEFTAARNALVRELQKAGAKDHAEEVRNLRKPAASAWAVNQLARRHPQQIRELIEAGTVLRKAQRDALAGKKADVREAARAQHALVDDLVDTAREILAEAGVRATTAAAQRISSTLRAASSDPAAAKHLRAGRLRDDVEAVGFGPLLHVAPKPGRRRPERRSARAKSAVENKKLAVARERVRDERKALAEAQQAAAAARKEVARAEREVERASARLQTAERRAASLSPGR
jgi:hypothetical protein